MKQVSATDAARGFSEVLDSVESKGESFLIVRHGRPVAVIGPAAVGTGRALKDVLRSHRPDPDWAGELCELRRAVGPADLDRWGD